MPSEDTDSFYLQHLPFHPNGESDSPAAYLSVVYHVKQKVTAGRQTIITRAVVPQKFPLRLTFTIAFMARNRSTDTYTCAVFSVMFCAYRCPVLKCVEICFICKAVIVTVARRHTFTSVIPQNSPSKLMHNKQFNTRMKTTCTVLNNKKE